MEIYEEILKKKGEITDIEYLEKNLLASLKKKGQLDPITDIEHLEKNLMASLKTPMK